MWGDLCGYVFTLGARRWWVDARPLPSGDTLHISIWVAAVLHDARPVDAILKTTVRP